MPDILRFHRPEDEAGQTTVASVIDAYLAHLRAASTCQRTLEDKEHVLELFAAEFGWLVVGKARPHHLGTWIASQRHLGSNWTIRRWISSVKSAFTWAVQHGIEGIEINPFLGVRCKRGRRGRALEDHEFRAMMRLATDGLLKRFLLFLRLTGCRPGEAAKSEWAHLDLLQGRIVLEEHKTADVTQEPREIYLTPSLIRLLIWIRRNDPHPKFIFVNRWRNPWKASALSQRLKVIRRKAGLPKDAKYYGCRHALATQAILNGVEVATLAQLLGHKDLRTTMIYIHLAGKARHLGSAIQQAVRIHPPEPI